MPAATIRKAVQQTRAANVSCPMLRDEKTGEKYFVLQAHPQSLLGWMARYCTEGDVFNHFDALAEVYWGLVYGWRA